MLCINGLEYFKLEVLQTSGVVVVVVTSEFSQPSKAYLPLVSELQNSYGSTLKFYQVVAEDNDEITKTYKIRSYPTTLVFKAGNLIYKNTTTTPPILTIKPIIDGNI